MKTVILASVLLLCAIGYGGKRLLDHRIDVALQQTLSPHFDKIHADMDEIQKAIDEINRELALRPLKGKASRMGQRSHPHHGFAR